MLLPTRTLTQAGDPPNRRLVAASAAKAAPALASLSNADADTLFLQASDAVARFCGVASVAGAPPTLARQSVIETIYFASDPFPPQPRELFLSLAQPALTTLMFDSDIIDPAHLRVSGRTVAGRPAASFRYFPAERDIIAIYEAGYVSGPQKALSTPPAGPDLPADIERAVILVTQHFYGLQQRAQFDISARVEEDADVGRIETRYFSIDRGGGIPADAQALLAPYCEIL